MAAKGVGIVMWASLAATAGQLDVQRLPIASALAQAAPLAWPRL